MQDILPVTAPIFLTIAIGYLTVRLGGLTKADVAGLGKFVINLSLPALLFRALSQNPLAEILNGAYLAAYALGSLTMLLLGTAFARFVRKQSLQASALTGMGMSSSNSGFIGYPIVLQVLGPTAGIGLALAMVVENLLVLPVFLVLAESGAAGGGSVRHALAASFRRLALNPLILAIVVGFGFALLGVRPPVPVAKVIDLFAAASGAVALFTVGGALVGLRIRGLLADVTRIVGAKLLLHPLAVFAALSLLPPIDPKLRIAAVLFASSPMLTVYPIFGQKYGREDVCAAALMTATALSFASVSAVLWLMDRGGWLAVLR
ncbi:AEC family transporter [Azospirillum doebereinerae]|uniref:AEC family transporter n=1 Tax=Azospirillum doebereinerae TaxID=92933 RepID=UPI001EE59A2D|nr:AEC family transporter [Azospirillum doebereinerae]MCG5243368.1 AEC family transporter [Azospirillum doebereinerae]